MSEKFSSCWIDLLPDFAAGQLSLIQVRSLFKLSTTGSVVLSIDLALESIPEAVVMFTSLVSFFSFTTFFYPLLDEALL